jgi:DNA-binding transcriptional LysR family regulator
MDIRQLEYFSEVAKHLSFTKAASTLHVSQPSISKAIQNLEAELGVPLFYRSSKQLELTDAGLAVLSNTLDVLYSFSNLRTQLTDLLSMKKGQIRIGIPPIIGAEFFSKYISDYKEAYPFIEIHLTEVGTKMIRKGVEAGELDIGLICNGNNVQEPLAAKQLHRDPLMLVVHKDHPLAALDVVPFELLKQESFIIYPKDFTLHDRIIEECSKHHFYPSIACESSQKDLMVALVAAKLGITILPKQICEKLAHPSLIAIPFEKQNIYLELGVVWKQNQYLSNAVREFLAITNESTLGIS